MNVDLHIHTTFSDGLLTPNQVVIEASRLHLKAIAITDHDTVEGVPLALSEAEKHTELEVIPGIELSTDWKCQEVHILGYYLDYLDCNLKTTILKFQQGRKRRVGKIIERLKEIGINIAMKDVEFKSLGPSLGRPHVASVLIEKGYVNSIDEAFEKYLDMGKPTYIPREKVTPFNAIDIIKKSNGIPVLAHPGLLKNQSIIDDLISNGIMGIEVYHKNHTPAQIDYYSRLALKSNLLITGVLIVMGNIRFF